MAWPPADEPRLLTDPGVQWSVDHVLAIMSPWFYEPRAFRIGRSLGPILFDRVQNVAPLALTGGDELVRDFVRYPTHALCTTLGLEQLSLDLAGELARSPHLAKVRHLVVHAPKVQLAPVLASPHASRLESITVVDVMASTLRALATVPPSVHTLRIHNAARAIATGDTRMDAVATLLSTIATRLVRLELHGLGAPIEALAGNSQLEALQELVLVGCQLRGAELLGTLSALRTFDARESIIDDHTLAAVVACPRLATLALRATAIDDDDARMLASAPLPHLRTLDIEGTAITDAGAAAIVRSPALPALADLAMDRRDKYRPLVPLGSGPDAARTRLVDITDATTWLPPRRIADYATTHAFASSPAEEAQRFARAYGEWPRSPLPFDRQFRHRTIYACEYCGGAGACPPERHRPLHEPEPHRGPLPPRGNDVVTIARMRLRFEAAETLVRQLARSLDLFGAVKSLHVIEWQLHDEAWATYRPSSYPPQPYDRLVARLGPLPLASTPRWPYVALLAARAANQEALVELFEICVAIYDLGFWLGEWRDDVCEIYMPRDQT